MNTYLSSSSAATKRFGFDFARRILKSKQRKKAVVVALVGELGCGKTTFAQGFAAGLGVRERVSSPTFILMRISTLKRKRFLNFIHVDAYRAEAKDFLKLGFKKLAADPKNIILIEWADRLKRILPKSVLWVRFRHGGKRNERIIGVIANNANVGEIMRI